jgi:membrane protein required for colicin V production
VASLDIAIAVVVLLSALIGLVRGLIKEILSLASWVVAFILAIYFAPPLAAQFSAEWGAESVRLVIAFAAIFVVALIAGALLQWLIAKVVASTGLSGTDRFLGFLFGSARGLLVCIVVLMGLREVAADASWWQESVLRGELLAFEDDVRELLGRARDAVRDVQTPTL